MIVVFEDFIFAGVHYLRGREEGRRVDTHSIEGLPLR